MTPQSNGNPYKDAAASARAASLRYVSDEGAGIHRRRAGKGFHYLNGGGRRVAELDTLSRIRALAIPPAWREVWICPRADGHIQATGRDARGRKQYRYHRRWQEIRDETKFGRMAAFAAALPRIRRRVRRDLAARGLPQRKVLAAVVRLLETTFARIGNEEYARANASFGITTLRERQVRVHGDRVKFDFRGKSGVRHAIELTDPRLAAIVRRMRDLPGYELFQYVDDAGERRRVESSDVNAYIKEIAGAEFSSKDFRTWAATALCARELRRAGPARSRPEAVQIVKRAIEAVALELRNTPAVCRKCYIHPRVIERYLAGDLAALKARRGGMVLACMGGVSPFPIHFFRRHR